MKNKITILALNICMLITSLESVEAANILLLDNPNIHYDGAFYTQVTPTLVTFNRHKPEVYNNTESGIYGSWINQWVITQTGVRIRFKTSSPTITFTFQKRTGGGTVGANPTNGFSVFANNTLLANYSTLSFTINNPNAGNSSSYEVSLPNLWAIDLIGMALDDTYDLEDTGTLTKPTYIAIGDSKAHGTGQYVSSAKTYPFQLASLMQWNLYNIAVAGSTLGWAIALNVKGVPSVDFITVELGYNDFYYLSENLAAKQNQYERLIDSLRFYQPLAKIFCITPITTTTSSGAAPYSLDQYRNMVQTVVSSRMQTDPNIFVIPGPSYSNATMLASGDPVHLSESGALTLANNLAVPINDPSSIVLITTSNENTQESTKKKIDIYYLSNSKLNLNVEQTGYYVVEIYDTNGKSFCKSYQTYLNSGGNEINFACNGLKIGTTCIVRIQKEKFIESKLMYVSE